MKLGCVLGAFVLAGACLPCVSAAGGAAEMIGGFADMAGRTCGVQLGSVSDQMALQHQPQAKIVTFNDNVSIQEALSIGRIDAAVLDTILARRWLVARAGRFRIAEQVSGSPTGYFFAKGSPLCGEVNSVLRAMVNSGEVDRLIRKWCEASDIDAVQPEPVPPSRGKGGRAVRTLKFAGVGDVEPAYFVRRGRIVGFDVDIWNGVMAKLGYRAEFSVVASPALIAAVATGKADVGGCSVTITTERARKVDFTIPYVDLGYSLVVRDETRAAAAPVRPSVRGASRTLVESFRRTFVDEERWRMLLAGYGVTLLITTLATLLGTLLAFPVWRARVSRVRAVSALARAYIAVLQGTPVLVLLMIFFYIVFARVDIDGVWVAVVAFALNLAAYAGEMLRAGINGVPVGQTEAALALGYTPRRAFLRFVLPQAVRSVLPLYRGEVIGLLKATSVVGYIAVTDLTKASDLVRGRTYEAFFPMLSTAFVYFVSSWLLACALTWLGNRMDPAHGRRGGRP